MIPTWSELIGIACGAITAYLGWTAVTSWWTRGKVIRDLEAVLEHMRDRQDELAGILGCERPQDLIDTAKALQAELAESKEIRRNAVNVLLQKR